MEVEYDSANSGCSGAFERRRETSTICSTIEERWEKTEDKMETIEGHINEMMRIMKTMMDQTVKLQEDIQEVKNGEKEAKATMRAKAQARAAAKARKRAKAKQRKQVKLDGDLDAEAEAISGGDAVLASEGDKYESFTDNGTFYEANVGGDDDEKYEDDDFSIAEVLPAPCDSDRIFGMCFANVNVERVFLYFHYEYVKC